MSLDQTRVMIVEDDDDLRAMLEEAVGGAGFLTRSARNGAEALDKLEEADLLLTDLMMPGLDGIALLKEARRICPELPVIVMTGHATLQSAVEAVNCGASGYLAKPFGIDALIMSLRQAERQRRLMDQVRTLTHALMSINDSVYITDMENVILFVNAAFSRNYGYGPDEALGKKCDMLWKKGEEYGTSHIFRKTTSDGWTNEFVDLRKDGGEVPIILSASLVRDRHGKSFAIVRVTRDITERKRLEKTLLSFSYLDGLTGIPNRRSFDEKLAAEWERAVQSVCPLSLVMADVDFLKTVNDLFGHQVGDQYLRKVGGLIRDSLRWPDYFAARFGGDEFAVLLPKTPEYEARAFAESLRVGIQNLNLINPGSLNCLTVSIGLASLIPRLGEGPESLFSKADEALYRAKMAGRNRTC